MLLWFLMNGADITSLVQWNLAGLSLQQSHASSAADASDVSCDCRLRSDLLLGVASVSLSALLQECWVGWLCAGVCTHDPGHLRQ